MTSKGSFLLVTGMSGAGKTQAMRALEDMGYFCIDNYPLSMIQELLDSVLLKHAPLFPRIAIATDVRGKAFLADVDEQIQALEKGPLDFSLLFLDARDQVLMNRYKESRRTHPLQGEDGLLAAIGRERKILAKLRGHAQRVVDTSALSLKDYKGLLYDLYGKAEARMTVTVLSFGFKFGLPLDADLVFDVRFLPNPYYDPLLRPLTGLDTAVQEEVLGHPETQVFLDHTQAMLDFLIPQYIKEGKKQLVLAVGCTGGQHRSVTLTECLADALGGPDLEVLRRHREISRYR